MTPQTTKVLVCQSLPAGERQAAVLAAFDALSVAESMTLESDHLQTPVLALLQRERPGRFEWSPQLLGPPVWRTEITRRAAVAPAREVAEALSWDHDRLHDLERAARAARERGDFAAAAASFTDFANGLRRHIGFEDDLLFPEFERRSGIGPEAGPTTVLRAEHREIEALLSELEATVGRPDAAVEVRWRQLERVLEDHNVKEEAVLYPGTDQLLSEAERDQLVRRIQAYPAKLGGAEA